MEYTYAEEQLKLLNDALDALGFDPAVIAERLNARNIKGQRESPYFCPVAQYLVKTKHFSSKIWVHKTFIEIGDLSFLHITMLPARSNCLIMPLPDCIRAFITRFDKGDYPELEE